MPSVGTCRKVSFLSAGGVVLGGEKIENTFTYVEPGTFSTRETREEKRRIFFFSSPTKTPIVERKGQFSLLASAQFRRAVRSSIAPHQ